MPGIAATRVLRAVRAMQIGIVLTLGVILFIVAQADKEGQGAAFITDNQRDWLHATPAGPSDAWTVALGGRLYDNWAAVQFKELPEETHPAYPAAGRQSGGATWRCTECHGWDGNGAAGLPIPEEHHAGFPGVRAVRGVLTADGLRQILRDDRHHYDRDKIPDTLIPPLTAFLDHGQVDIGSVVAPGSDGVAEGGDGERGRGIFQNVCAVCHGYDGKAIDFGGTAEPEYLGTVARVAPAEFVHKMVNGQPGQPMPVMRPFGDQAIRDLFAYARTLPTR